MFLDFVADVGGLAAALIFLFSPVGAYLSQSNFKQEFINQNFMVKYKKGKAKKPNFV